MYKFPYILATALCDPFWLITCDKDLEEFKRTTRRCYDPDICPYPKLLFSGIPKQNLGNMILEYILFEHNDPDELACFVQGNIYEESKSESLYVRLRNNKDKTVYIYEVNDTWGPFNVTRN